METIPAAGLPTSLSMDQSDRRPPTSGASDSRARFVFAGFWPGFLLVTSVFFAWALANNLNDILIRQFQKALALTRGEAGFIQFVFYLAYFVWALPAGLLLRRFGYRAGLLTGLGLYALGALLFFPAAALHRYEAFLLALFVLASGAAFLETSANPYVARFGDPSRAPQRLTFAQAFNGLGAVVAPILGGLFIFSGVEHTAADLSAMSHAQLEAWRASEAAMVKIPYLCLAGFVLLLGVGLARVRLPHIERSLGEGTGSLRSVLSNRLLRGAVFAQFFYVGAQVGIWSFFVDFTKHLAPQTPERTAAFLLSASLFLFMAGRFAGAALMHRGSPPRLLLVFALANIVMVALAMSLSGPAAIACLAFTSFFMSIMFPTIFALGIRDLGEGTAMGSSLVVMAVMGGAVFPPIMGLLSEKTDLQVAMALPLACFLAVAFFARLAAREGSGIA
ncbi:L-fucose:H+ symporter permease [Novosphingobium sp. TCA1]|uniref:L-fucose:H+ symporter permease n=1 Tax=Novosphingobium sp. TCA1 TaxID=2682474 RepID=UPI00130A802E|nr:L-fucose:H+ symporter permease [Novosphingobium sp. TCA1]GFE74577.1 L-fucose:H+ symporter permease [Novosphingobium sp. TCA1]